MSTINGTIEYTCNKGTLWRDSKGYHWTSSKDGKDNWIQENTLKVIPKLKKFETAIYSTNVTILNVNDTILMGCKDVGSWEEIDWHMLIGKDGGIDIYTGKNNTGLAILVDENDKATDLISVLSVIARKGMDRADEYINKFRWITWLEGQANWQGKPLSKNQELKLRLIDGLNKEPYKNYKAARLATNHLVIDVYVNNLGEGLIPLRCDNKHKFYEEACYNGIT